ncbi:hypothetical protein GBA52_008399 [Prunus armeniaca]|nr:hypothetical protein GBA52_008399 [Prunus armeniaca]
MFEKYEHLHTKNVEQEHDYRTLKRNWERNQGQSSQHDFTQDAEHTQPNQPVHSHHSASVQSRLSKGKGPTHPETTKLRLLHISPSKDRPHEPVKIYRDCRDRLLDRQTDPILIPVNLQAPRVTDLGPPPKPTHLLAGEGAGDSDNWENYHSEDWENYHTEVFEEWEPYSAPAHPHPRPSALDTLPHADPTMRLFFERLESEEHRSH